jgi:hypothetical protein
MTATEKISLGIANSKKVPKKSFGVASSLKNQKSHSSQLDLT